MSTGPLVIQLMMPSRSRVRGGCFKLRGRPGSLARQSDLAEDLAGERSFAMSSARCRRTRSRCDLGAAELSRVATNSSPVAAFRASAVPPGQRGAPRT